MRQRRGVVGTLSTTAACPDCVDSRPTVVIYRDFLLPFSETFILAQARALLRFHPVLVGRHRVEGLDLGGLECELINSGGWRGVAYETFHRLGSEFGPHVGRLARRRPVLLHAHFGPDALNALALTRRLRVPLLVTFHGYDAPRRGDLSVGSLQRRYVRRLPQLAKSAACVLAVSDYIRRSVLEAGFPAEKVRTHYIGVDVSRFTPADRSERQPIVLAVGRFVEKKGFEHLIDAMVDVQERCPGARLVLIGYGPLAADLGARARGRLNDFEMPGPLPADAVAQWMRRARVLATPSVTAASGETEGLPITLLEGLASALPVVGTRHAGIPEAIDHGVNGLLVAERDPVGLAAALIELLSDDDRWDSMSAAGRRTAENRFNLVTQTAALERIYSELAFTEA